MQNPAISSLTGTIRQLRPSDLERFRQHLLRLDARGRRDRFNGGIGDEFVSAYAERSLKGGTTVVGYLEDDLVLGAAEIHERPEEKEPTAEIAFSVEQTHRSLGLGTLLFARLLAHARSLGYTRLLVTTHPDNSAMKRLARKFSADLRYKAGDTVGVIELNPLPQLGERSPGRWWRLSRARPAKGPGRDPFGFEQVRHHLKHPDRRR